MRRETLLHVGLVFLVFAANLALARPTSEPLALAIAAAEAPIRESNLSLRVTMTNHSAQPMTLVKSNPGCDFTAVVKDANGRSVALTQAAVELSRCQQRLTMGRWIQVTLKPGESTDESYPVDLYYALPRPGTYSVQLTREVPSHPKQISRSNEIILKLAQ